MPKSKREDDAPKPEAAAPRAKKAKEAAKTYVFVVTLLCEALCGCGGDNSTLGVYSNARAAKRALRKSQFKELGDFFEEILGNSYTGAWPPSPARGAGGEPGPGASAGVAAGPGEPTAAQGPAPAEEEEDDDDDDEAGYFEGAVAAFKDGDPAAEQAFDVSQLGSLYRERWAADGTGKASLTEEFSGCFSCNRTWSIVKSRVEG